jgi:chromosome segregation ATPase
MKTATALIALMALLTGTAINEFTRAPSSAETADPSAEADPRPPAEVFDPSANAGADAPPREPKRPQASPPPAESTARRLADALEANRQFAQANEQLRARIEEFSASLDQANEVSKDLHARNQQLAGELTEAREQLADARGELADRNRADTGTDELRRQLATYINALDKANTVSRRLDQQRQQLSAENAQLEAALAELANERDAYALQARRAEHDLDDAVSDVRTLRRRAAFLKRELDEANAASASAHARLANHARALTAQRNRANQLQQQVHRLSAANRNLRANQTTRRPGRQPAASGRVKQLATQVSQLRQQVSQRNARIRQLTAQLKQARSPASRRPTPAHTARPRRR